MPETFESRPIPVTKADIRLAVDNALAGIKNKLDAIERKLDALLDKKNAAGKN